MKSALPIACSVWVVLAVLAAPVALHAQFTFTTNNGAITITGYTGSSGAVVIPDTTNGYPVVSIGVSAFRASSVTGVTIPNSITSIGTYAFEYCSSLTSVTIPNSVTNIGFAAFFPCASLTAITVDAQNSVYSSVNGVLFDKSQGTLIEYPDGKLGSSYSIPSCVTSIGVWSFGNCAILTSVTIPKSVTNIGSSAFEGCTGLTHAIIGSGVASIGNLAFDGCTSLTALYFQGNAPSLGSNVFINDSNLVIYYMQGTAVWGSTFGGRPAVLWNPQAVTLNVAGGQFGFNITGPTNVVIVVEACTNLINPIWLPVSTNTLTGGASSFSDLQSFNYLRRFYRFRSP